MDKMRRTKNLLWLATAVLVSGCAGDSDVERVGKFLIGALNASGEKITRERAAAVPYATMGLALGANAEVLLVLGTAGATGRSRQPAVTAAPPTMTASPARPARSSVQALRLDWLDLLFSIIGSTP